MRRKKRQTRNWDELGVNLDHEYLSNVTNLSQPSSISNKAYRAYRNIISYAPHPIQYAFHRATNKIRAFYGGPRSGKSTAGVIEMIWWCTGTHPHLETPPPPIFARSVAPDVNRSVFRILLPKYKTFCGEIGGPILKDFLKERGILQFSNGSEIEFMSYEQDVNKFAGQALHVVHFDEEPRKDIYSECLDRTIDYDGRIILTFTPQYDRGYTWSYYDIRENMTKDPTQLKYWLGKYGLDASDDRYVLALSNGEVPVPNELERKALAMSEPLVRVFDCKTNQNPYLKRGSFDKVSALTGDDRYGGTYVARSSLVFAGYFDEVSENGNVRDKLPDNISYKELMYCIGIDHQEGRNPEGIVICGVDRYNRTWVIDEVYFVGLVEQYAQAIHESVAGHPISYGVVDHNACIKSSVSGFSAKDVYGHKGIHLVPAMKGHGSVDRGIEIMKRMFMDKRLIILRRCVNTIRQIRHCTWANWVGRTRDQKDPKERLMSKEIHLVDALRYVLLYGGTDGPRYRDPQKSVPHQPRYNYKPASSKTGY